MISTRLNAAPFSCIVTWSGYHEFYLSAEVEEECVQGVYTGAAYSTG